MADLILEREDADLINNCYQNPRSIHPLHLYLHSYFYRPEIYDPIFEVNFSDVLDELFVEFVNEFLQQPLKDIIWNSSDVLDFFTRLLLQHNCHIEDSCKNHILLIMKLRTVGIQQISLFSIIRDFHVLTNYKSDIQLLALYYQIFIANLGLTIVFFTKYPLVVLQYFLETATIFVPFYLNIFDDFSHGFLTNRDFKRLELFITFGARNLELFGDRYNYYVRNYSHEFDYDDIVILIINTRIKMRIIQIFFMFKAQNAILLQKIVATNQEPYLTKQQYEAAFYEMFPDESRMLFAPVIERRWNWYKKVFQIEDDTPVMPRKLQDICRLSIREILARRGQLPSGLDSIYMSDILRKYLKLEDLVEYSID